MRNRIAETIVRNLFQGDQSYMPDALACADDILQSPEAGKIRKALDQVNGIIESTYAHDETGERIDETDPEFSSADIVEFVMEVEGIVGEAIEAIGGIEGTTTTPVEDVGATVNELRNLAAQYNDLMAERELAEDGNGERSVERIDEEIDELLGETMAVTGRLLTPETSSESQTKPAHIIVVYDKETDHEAIYVDGLLFDSDLTMYASDMVRAIGERTVVNVSSVDVLLTPREAHWPKRFDDLMKFVIDTENDDQ